MMGANQIITNLYQGSMPEPGTHLRDSGVDVLVLCAEEYQPKSHNFPGVAVVHAPLNDHLNPLTDREWRTILDAGEFSSIALRKGKVVLVTCAMGINRSGIITAVTLMAFLGCSSADAVAQIQKKRRGALRNTSFVRQLTAFSP